MTTMRLAEAITSDISKVIRIGMNHIVFEIVVSFLCKRTSKYTNTN